MKLDGVACDTLIVDGTPGPALVKAAANIGADLVVVGNRRRKISSVVDHVIGNLSVAVLVVNAAERGQAAAE
jgi:nucleotide-binding universal stress UspA family protein